MPLLRLTMNNVTVRACAGLNDRPLKQTIRYELRCSPPHLSNEKSIAMIVVRYAP